MREVKDTCYKGTRIQIGNERRELTNIMVDFLTYRGFNEIYVPNIQLAETFEGKVGPENNNMMYTLTDRGNRNLCLAPEYTAVIQRLANTAFKNEKDVKLFYELECFRGEKPQAGRFRQFTQFGVEILNPTKDYYGELIADAAEMIARCGVDDYIVDTNVVRGLDYYEDSEGFEIRCERLGSSKQLCGGGKYDGGIGFAIGLDRLMLVSKLWD